MSAAVAAAALALLWPAAAQAQAPRILAPGAARVLGGKAIAAAVRGRGHVYVNSRDLSRRFRAVGRGIRKARLVRGRDFHLGLNRIVVADGRGAKRRNAARTFVAARPAKLLSVRRVRRPRLAPLELVGHSRTPLGRLRVVVNGKMFRQRKLLAAGGRSFRLRLGAGDGVRFGRNRIVIQGVTKNDRRFSRRTLTLRMPRNGPLPGAGPDRRAAVGRPLVVTAGHTKRLRRDDRLGFHWRIVSAPRGSQARLRRANSRRPLLVPDRRGRYVLQLVSTERTGARAAAGRAAASAAPTVGRDVMTVEAGPSAEPIGTLIETMAKEGGVKVGKNIERVATNWVQLLVLDRSTLTAKKNVGVEAPAGVESAAVRNLEGAIETYADEGDLVILSGGGRPVLLESPVAPTVFGEALNLIGVSGNAVTGPAGEAALSSGNWSAVGIRGSAVGTGTGNFRGVSTGGFGNALQSSPPGGLQGYLQFSLPPLEPTDSDIGGGYTFVSPDHVHLDTQAQSEDEKNVNKIQVGERVYSTPQFPTGASGFQVLFLNYELESVGNSFFITNEPGGTVNQAGVENFNALMAGLVGELTNPYPDLVIVQSVGEPSGLLASWVSDSGITSYPWGVEATANAEPLVSNEFSAWETPQSGALLAASIGALGGPVAHDQFAQMVGTNPLPTPSYKGGYTLVAPTREPSAAVSQSAKGSNLETAQVVGTLALNANSAWQVQNPSASDAFTGSEIMDVVYQKTESWPYSKTTSEKAANAYIARELGLTGGGVTEVRQAYYLHDTDDWNALERELREEVHYPSGSRPGFSRAEFAALKKQLEREFRYVGAVRNAVEQWQSVFNRVTATGIVDLQAITSKVEHEIEASIADRAATLETASIVGHSLGIVAGILGVSGLGPVAGAVGVVSSSLLLAGDFSQQKDGSLSALPVRAEAAKLGVEIANRYEQIDENLARVGDILVSDWGKLQTAAKKLNGEWGLNEDEKDDLARALEVSADRETYTAMVPLAYGIYMLAPVATELNSVPSDEPWTYHCTNLRGENSYLFPGAKNNPGGWIAFAYQVTGNHEIGFSTRLQPRVLAIQGEFNDFRSNQSVYVENEPTEPSAALTNKLFGPLADGGLGIDQVAFFANPALPRWPLYC